MPERSNLALLLQILDDFICHSVADQIDPDTYLVQSYDDNDVHSWISYQLYCAIHVRILWVPLEQCS